MTPLPLRPPLIRDSMGKYWNLLRKEDKREGSVIQLTFCLGPVRKGIIHYPVQIRIHYVGYVRTT